MSEAKTNGADPMKDAVRGDRRGAWLEDVWRDLRLGVRMLTRDPGFTAVAVTMLALGIAVNATVFTVTNAVLFKGFPLVERNDRLRYIGYKTTNCCVSYPDFLDWRAQSTSFSGMAIVHGVGLTVSDANGFAESLNGNENSADTFRLVGQKPFLGRDFTPSDETPGATPVAILRRSRLRWTICCRPNGAIRRAAISIRRAQSRRCCFRQGRTRTPSISAWWTATAIRCR